MGKPRRSRPSFRKKPRQKPQPETQDEPLYLLVGQVLRPHGVRGEVVIRVITEHPERLTERDMLYVGEDYTPRRLTRARRHHKKMLLTFEGITGRDEADMLREQNLYIHRDDAIPLEDGEYYLYQIQGMRVITDEGQTLGRISGLIETGANDVYEITTDQGEEILLPAIPQVILNVDVDANVMTVHLLDGLLE